jgi:RHS repeat-associated protein
VTYTYDGDSNRLKKSNGTEYWGAGPLLESDGSGSLQREFIFAGGRRIARRDIASGVVYYYFTDLLGSSDVVTSSAGAIQNESDYFPYGGERIYSQTVTNQNYKFTGKERDGESGLDNFGARYDSSNLGRFMTPDWAARPTAVPYAVFGDPQSLNLYGYVRNDPVSQADADGHEDPPHHGTKAPQGASKCKANVSGPCTDNADGSPDGSPPAKSWWQKAFSYFYVKTGNGRGVGLNNVKVGPGKIDVIFRTNGKDVKQTTQSKTVTTVNSEVGIKVELGPLKLGVERTNTQEEGQPPKTEWVPGYEWGEFKGSNAEVGVGGGGCFILCGQIEVGVQADKVLSDVRDAAASALEPVLTSGK